MSASPSHLRPSTLLEDTADSRLLAQILRALRTQPGVAALCAPPDRARALLSALAGRLGPPFRVLAVRGGALDPDAFCERALRAFHAEVSDEPRAVLETYLAHLHSRGARLALLVDAADALPEATVEWLAHRVRDPTSALCVVAAGEEPASLLRLVDRCGATASLIRLGGESSEGVAQDPGAHAERQPAASPPTAGSTVPALVVRRQRPVAWPIGAASLAAALVAGLFWSRAGEEVQPRPSEEPPPVIDSALDRGVAALADPAANRPGVENDAELRPDLPRPPVPAPVEVRPIDVALDALEVGDADAFKSAIRRIESRTAVEAEAELLARLDDAQRQDRERRMLAAWGLGLVGSRDALAPLDVAAEDADPHVAALAERSAALIRTRLARQESGPELR
jgi:hypothetical protein